MRYYVTVLFLLLVLAIPWTAASYPASMSAFVALIEQAGQQLAAVILTHDPKTLADIRGDYNAPPSSDQKARILIVPGHEPDYGGAEYIDPAYGHVYERNFTVELGQDLQADLGNDPHFQTFISRDAQAWSPFLADYFKNDWNDIVAWVRASKQQFSEMVAAGSTTMPVATVDHATAPDDVALRIYGMTKWSNENNVDLEIHIHFNDYPGHGESTPGKYSGFAVYVPVAQYQNSTTTHAIADAVFKRLAKYNPVSDLPAESVGVVDDPELIALGANDTADAASMLIEYSYIYEPQLDNPATRDQFIKDLAYQTYLGLEDFFDPAKGASLARAYDTVTLPYAWKDPIASGTSGPDVFALQTALVEDGEYPPSGETMNDCPRTGKLGPCTETALKAFQDKYGITGEQGTAGPKTIQELNQKFGVNVI